MSAWPWGIQDLWIWWPGEDAGGMEGVGEGEATARGEERAGMRRDIPAGRMEGRAATEGAGDMVRAARQGGKADRLLWRSLMKIRIS